MKKWHREKRPKDLKNVVGNEKVKRSIERCLREKGELPQVILLEGESGCGKTSIARILAKTYLCERRDERGLACGECESCKEMDKYIESGESGELYNVEEVDISGRNKKSDIEDIIDRMEEPIYGGGKRVYIMDECHMMTSSGQNRLLKPLEEPREGVLVIMCTTEVERLLETIRSRCEYRYKISRPKQEELEEYVEKLLEEEGVEYNKRGVKLLCKSGGLVPRRVLMDIEKVLKEKGDIKGVSVEEVLGVRNEKHYELFYKYIKEEQIDTLSYIGYIYEIKEEIGIEEYLKNLIEYTIRGVYIKNGVIVEGMTELELKSYKKVFDKVGVIEISKVLKRLLDIEKSRTKEAELLLLGYEGIGVDKELEGGLLSGVGLNDVKEIKASKERLKGVEKYRESIEVKEEEKEELYNKTTEVVDVGKLLDIFGDGVKIDI